ncbi:F-box protein [Micractinium conductrix]|uniref:F-box protein n=1 Tax=Micractinium conductrix TaxID=554055 RepID=A0A2P6UZ10_9CHLO|nr:F-box protein [Micractinium conductrix]|eukprot:PSC67070.1 F-box protein [Micractinium conductrix]
MEHPHGVQPALGVFGDGGDAAAALRSAGLGALACLPDEALLNILETLGPRDLAHLACASRACWVFCQHDELWKGLCLEEAEGGWDFQGSWQDTYLAAKAPAHRRGARKPRRVPLQSDLLYTPWLCATAAVDPAWLEIDNVERRSGLSVAEFREQYELPNRPVILTDVVLVGDQPISFDAYCKYSDANNDELPLYLFDKTFCKTAPQLAEDYAVPELFAEDLFSLLGESRPDFRWLIIGPFKSGSSWHKDPNSTSAWNGVVRGSKKWVMYPPHVTPPGVRPSQDGADVASPVSLMEWFMSFYEHRDTVGYTPRSAY